MYLRKGRIKTWQPLLVLALFLSMLTFSERCFAVPMNNIQDTQPIYTPFGSDKFYTEKKGTEIRFHLSPFYQQTKSARDDTGKKVPIGDIYGPWNMFGVFFKADGANASTDGNPLPTGKTLANFTNLQKSYNELKRLRSEKDTTFANGTQTNLYRDKDFTSEAEFNPDIDTVGTYEAVPVRYEKMGVRGQLCFDFSFGLGLGVRMGLVNYRQIQEFSTNNDFKRIAGLPYTTAASGVTTDNPPLPVGDPGFDPSANLIAKNVLDGRARDMLASDLELDLSDVHETEAEDSHVYLFWRHAFRINDKDNYHVASIIPYFSVGIWLPTGEEKDQNRPFSIATGNDGFTGISLEGSLNFDFPKTIQVGLGGGFVFFNERDLVNQRVPSSLFQSGITPWKVNICKEPGMTWYVNASFKSDDFIKNLSFYFDYLYTEHLKDEVTLLEKNATRAKAFAPGVSMLQDQSQWKNQQFNIGFDYRIAPFLAIGVGAQAHISGIQVYRSTTLIGSIGMTF
jgi:hypothetical protein